MLQKSMVVTADSVGIPNEVTSSLSDRTTFQPMSALHDTLLEILTTKSDIDGRFDDIQPLADSSGSGSFSVVVVANDNLTRQRVALKVCLPTPDRYRAASFDREATILASLQGAPDIVRLVGELSEFTELFTHATGLQWPVTIKYYAVELASTDIRGIIADGTWTIDRFLISFRTICRAVQRIHARRIAHRDLKPSNFLVMHDHSIRLSDFGTATHVDSNTSPLLPHYHGAPGDVRYCAPEMLVGLHGEDPDIAFRADMFSLGATLFEMCTGDILGLRLFDSQFRTALLRATQGIRPSHRRLAYDRIISGMANARPLPGVGSFGTPVPGAVCDRLDELYRGLAAIDYRRRLSRFDRVFHQINTCILILRHEAKYQRWLMQRQRRREDRAQHAARVFS